MPVVPSGLVHYWPLDVVTTVTPDLIGGADGTLNGSTSLVPGKISNCAQFTGGSDNIQTFVNAGFTKASAFSLSAWVKSSTSTGSSAILMTAVDTGNFDGIWFIYSNSNDSKISASIVDTGINQIKQVSNAALTNNIFHHVVAAYDGSNTVAGILLYADGALLATTPTGTTLPGSFADRAWRIGNDNSPSDTGFTGLIDDVLVYNRALSGAEVLAIYQDGISPSPPTLMAQAWM